MSIKDNLAKIKADLPAHVTLVAVSKTKPAALVREAYECGQRDFGENYVQELSAKQAELPADIRWHAIGHLQSNKVKYVAPFIHLLHGIDSYKLLQEVNKQALKQGRVIDCLLQVYIAEEESKFGLDFEECGQVLQNAAQHTLANVRITGFMGMATNTDNEAQIRKEFRSLRQFFERTAASTPHPLSILSMGMSSDYRIAVDEGSTMVRIGSSIFGERNYQQ
jgi:PLP dependent protein